MTPEFDHRQTAHCESGAMAALLRHNGLALSEPMVFGISGALTFAYIPLLKVGGMPLLAYRLPPGRIIKGLSSRLGIDMRFHRYRKPEQGMAALDENLDAGRPVGLQTSVYWLPYFPQDMRFHFNAHNLVAIGRNADTYQISDPTFESISIADRASLQRARFVKGMLAPKGLLYYPQSIPQDPPFRAAIVKSIRDTVNMMLRAPFPFVGVNGIGFVARKIRRMQNDSSEQALHRNKLFIGHMVRMQEEIGTGGAGFRFLYASFLQESAGLIAVPELSDIARQFTDAGDEWRRFALYAAKMLKGRMPLDFEKLADQLYKVMEMERSAYIQLRDLKLKVVA